MVVESGINRTPVEAGWLNAAYPRLCGNARNNVIFGKVGPCLAAISGQLQVAIVCSSPNHVFVQRRFGYREDGTVVFCCRIVLTQTSGVLLVLFLFIIGGKVWR